MRIDTENESDQSSTFKMTKMLGIFLATLFLIVHTGTGMPVSGIVYSQRNVVIQMPQEGRPVPFASPEPSQAIPLVKPEITPEITPVAVTAPIVITAAATVTVAPAPAKEPLIPTYEPIYPRAPELRASPKPSAGVTLDNRRACFPSDARVRLSDATEVRISELRVGDLVESAPGIFSPVLLFTHANVKVNTRMVFIDGAKGRVAASPGHLISLNGQLAPTRTARVGDTILVRIGASLVKETVRTVSIREASGLHNPQTASGEILVRYGTGAYIQMSAYTEALDGSAAHAALAPLRALYSLSGATLPSLSSFFPATYFDSGTGENNPVDQSALSAASSLRAADIPFVIFAPLISITI